MWGGLQGVYLIVHRLWAASRLDVVQRLRAAAWWPWVARLLMFHAVCIGWVFFRSPTFSLAAEVFRRLGSGGALTLATMPVVITLLLGLFGQYAPRVWRRGVEAAMSRMPVAVNGAALAFGVFLIEVLGPTGVAPFIYFQF
jgi:alginate O-acetyltransferase complex protein AlgI